MSFFEQLLKVLWAHNTAQFFPIWITITGAAAICVAAVGSGAPMWRCQVVLQASVGNVV
jgi:hypothetical protein